MNFLKKDKIYEIGINAYNAAESIHSRVIKLGKQEILENSKLVQLMRTLFIE